MGNTERAVGKSHGTVFGDGDLRFGGEGLGRRSSLRRLGLLSLSAICIHYACIIT